MKPTLALLFLFAAAAHGATGDLYYQRKSATGYTNHLLTPTTGQFLRWTAGGLLENATVSGSGTVTSFSVVTANGVSGSVATATTTPAVTFTLGAITPSSVTSAAGFHTAAGLQGTSGLGLFLGTDGTLTAGVRMQPLGNGILRIAPESGAGSAVVQIGGNTSSYPGIRNLGTTLEAVLADESNWAPFKASTGTFTGAVSASNISGSTSGTNTGDQNLSSYATTAAVAAGYQPLNAKLTSLSALANAAGVLTNNGSGTLSWAATGGTGTVTSIGISSPAGITVGASPVTTNGTITLTLDPDLVSIAALGTTSYGRSVLETADAAALRTLAGLGTLATQSGTFSGTSSGTNTGDQTTISGNAGTATAWATGRTLAITGDLAYTSPSFDGSANVTAAGTLATVNSNVGSFGSGTSIPNFTVNGKGLITAAGATTLAVASASITDGTIVNADINAAAAIDLSKLATNPLARANHTGTQTLSTISDAGTLAGLSAVASANVTDGTLVDADINASAAIAISKLATDPRLITVKSTATNYTIGTTSADELKGGVIYVTGACTLTIPAVSAGASFSVHTIGAVAVSVDPNAADLIVLDGTACSDGDKITNLSTAGDIAVFTYYDATGWHASTNGWTDTN